MPDSGARDELDVARVDLGERLERHRAVERLAALDGVERGVAERERDLRPAVAQALEVLDRAGGAGGDAAVALEAACVMARA